MNKFSKRFLSNVSSRDVRNARAYLMTAFTWSQSPQGREAWKEVCAALMEIERAKEKEAK